MRWIANGLVVVALVSFYTGCAVSPPTGGSADGQAATSAKLTSESEKDFVALLTDPSREFTVDVALANRAFELQSDVDRTRLKVLAAKHADTLTELQRWELTKLDRALAAIDAASVKCLKNLRNFQSIGYRAQKPVFDADACNVQFVLDQTQGAPIRTGRPFDVMISGVGYFQICTPGEHYGVSYTRAGNFFLSAEGQIVLGHPDGPLLEPAITIPDDATDIAVCSNGIVSGRVPGSRDRQEFGQFEIVRFIAPEALKLIHGHLLVETPNSGPPVAGEPDTDNFGELLHLFLESSNVAPFHELDQLHKYKRWLRLTRATVAALQDDRSTETQTLAR